jgi:hypothetical protein
MNLRRNGKSGLKPVFPSQFKAAVVKLKFHHSHSSISFYFNKKQVPCGFFCVFFSKERSSQAVRTQYDCIRLFQDEKKRLVSCHIQPSGFSGVEPKGWFIPHIAKLGV